MPILYTGYVLLKHNIADIFAILDPNTHIIWIDTVEARLKALRDIEAGNFKTENLETG